MRRLLALILMLFVVTPICLASEIVVNSTADSGTGTLRWALQTARNGDVITFDPDTFPPGKPATIYPSTELPQITCGHLTIDASNAGVIIDGSRLPGGWKNGIQVYSSSNVIHGLQVVNFEGSGIAVCGRIQGNTIGGDRSVGDGLLGQGNLLSGNAIGINLCDPGNTRNRVLGNLIGTDTSGGNPWPNSQEGVWVENGVTDTTIGPDNVIAFNGSWGIHISGSQASFNTITRNSIHSNTCGGIHLSYGANDEVAPPVILGSDTTKGIVMGVAEPSSTVEIFSDVGVQGMLYEGSATSDTNGSWRLDKESSMQGPHLTATLTDDRGSTSPFALPALAGSGAGLFQEGNPNSLLTLDTRTAAELEDNRIGDYPEARNLDWHAAKLLRTGYKWLRIELLKNGTYGGRFWELDWLSQPYTMDQEDRHAVRELAEAGVALMACLGALIDEDGYAERGRFRTQQEIALFHSYVRSVVREFQGEIDYYEIWNEPDVRTPNWYVELPDYVKLVQSSIPIIKEEYPEAKIVVGSTSNLRADETQEYLFRVLASGILPDVDVVSWHPTFGTSPEYAFYRDYYNSYPDLVREIKRTAEEEGFSGKYYAAEINYRTEGHYHAHEPWTYSPTTAAKYYARSIVLHLALDVIAGIISWGDNQLEEQTVHNLCMVMAGHEAIDMPVEIDIDYDGPVAYGAFRYPDGDRMLAVWTDGIAQDVDPGMLATIRFPGLASGGVTGIDVIHGFEQEVLFEVDGQDTIIRDLLVKDYPILIRLSEVAVGLGYEETVGDGFHQLGEPAAPDRDGDGVPDDEDFCPDWPGSKETNGC